MRSTKADHDWGSVGSVKSPKTVSSRTSWLFSPAAIALALSSFFLCSLPVFASFGAGDDHSPMKSIPSIEVTTCLPIPWMDAVLPWGQDVADGILHATSMNGRRLLDSRHFDDSLPSSPDLSFDFPIFVISNKEDRKRQSHRVLSDCGFTDVRYPDFVPPQKIKDTRVFEGLSEDVARRFQRLASLGPSWRNPLSLIVNHLQAMELGFEAMTRSEHDFFGIMEDDIMLASSPWKARRRLQDALKLLPSSADILYLEYCHEDCPENVSADSQSSSSHADASPRASACPRPVIARAVKPMCTAAMLFTRRGAAKILDQKMLQSFNNTLDMMYKDFIQRNVLEAFVCTPPLVLQDNFWSSSIQVSGMRSRQRGMPGRFHRPYPILCNQQDGMLDGELLLTSVQQVQTDMIQSCKDIEEDHSDHRDPPGRIGAEEDHAAGRSCGSLNLVLSDTSVLSETLHFSHSSGLADDGFFDEDEAVEVLYFTRSSQDTASYEFTILVAGIDGYIRRNSSQGSVTLEIDRTSLCWGNHAECEVQIDIMSKKDARTKSFVHKLRRERFLHQTQVIRVYISYFIEGHSDLTRNATKHLEQVENAAAFLLWAGQDVSGALSWLESPPVIHSEFFCFCANACLSPQDGIIWNQGMLARSNALIGVLGRVDIGSMHDPSRMTVLAPLLSRNETFWMVSQQLLHGGKEWGISGEILDMGQLFLFLTKKLEESGWLNSRRGVRWMCLPSSPTEGARHTVSDGGVMLVQGTLSASFLVQEGFSMSDFALSGGKVLLIAVPFQ